MIRDHDSVVTNEEMKKSVITMNDEESILLKKSIDEGDQIKNGQMEL